MHSVKTPWFAVITIGFALFSLRCAPETRGEAGDASPDGGFFSFDVPRGADVVRPTCEDDDHDGFGIDCRRGIDCDDTDPNVTDECYRCVAHAPGCPCEPGTHAVACDLGTDTDRPLGETCRLGQRNCVSGEWGHCTDVGDFGARTVQPVLPCPGLCDPGCQMSVTCPNATSDLSMGTNVALGADSPPVFCPTGSPPGGVTLPGGPTSATGTPRHGCTNLCLQQVTCPSGGTTTVTGTVYAPTPSQFLAPGGSPDPLYGAVVYVPNSPVAPFTPGVTCERCGAPASGDPLVSAVTGFDGRFTLTNVPVGRNIPLVIQLGRWRRQVVIPNVAACATNTLPADLTRMPRNQREGDIPRIAMVTGNVDALECVLRKIGIDDSEFTVPTSRGGRGRVQMYIANGADAPGGGAPSDSQLWSSATTLADYDMVLFACEGGQFDQNTAEQRRVIDYANAGGRVFATHYSYVWLYDEAPFSSTARWNVDQAFPPDPLLATIDTTFPKGQALADWLWLVNASPARGQIWLNQPREDFDGVVAPSQEWVYATRTVRATGGGTGSCGPGLTACRRGTCVDLNSDPSNCGACRNACATGQYCAAGVCRCPTGQTLCGGACVDLRRDGANCGGCDVVCGSGAACIAGACTCPTGFTMCSGDCIDLNANGTNCGACGRRCTGSRVCSAGTCVTGSCPAGRTACSRGCVDLQTDPFDCGACGAACATGSTCRAGRCSCPTGWIVCAGICVDPMNDAAHCGSCTTACGAGATCAGGSCACGAGRVLCGGMCVDTTSDITNCGACGNACAAGSVCSGGACVNPCGSARTACGSSCVDLQTDDANCGSCDARCGTGSSCVAGACTVTNHLHYTFNTPVGAPAADQCGRVVFSDFHVDNLSGGGGRRFPTECDNAPMTAQEKILEFMLFDLASCITPTSGPACGASEIACGSLCCGSGQICQTVGAGTQCFTPYPASGTYQQDVAATTCAPGFAPQWRDLVYVATTPPGTSIDVVFYSAATAAGLATATPIRLGTIPASASPFDLAAALAAARVSGILPYARVVFTLRSDATRTAAPTLDGYRLNFVCTPSF